MKRKNEIEEVIARNNEWPMKPGNFINKICAETGESSRKVRLSVITCLDRGLIHLDKNLEIAKGSFWG